MIGFEQPLVKRKKKRCRGQMQWQLRQLTNNIYSHRCGIIMVSYENTGITSSRPTSRSASIIFWELIECRDPAGGLSNKLCRRSATLLIRRVASGSCPMLIDLRLRYSILLFITWRINQQIIDNRRQAVLCNYFKFHKYNEWPRARNAQTFETDDTCW